MQKKGEVKAKVLYALSSAAGPMTVGAIQQLTLLPRSSIKDCLVRMQIERCVMKKKFSDERISPFNYKVSDKGRMPRYYYVLRYPLGLKKLQYFTDIGIIELK